MKSFGEDSQKMQPDEFFGMFDQFVASFNDARVENQKFRKQKEEEEKRARLEIQVEYIGLCLMNRDYSWNIL